MINRLYTLLIALLSVAAAWAVEPMSFALLTDIHLSASNPAPLEDLRRSIDEINSQSGVDFVLVSGDITEAGDYACLMQAKKEFMRLKVPFYATSGNHETTWSESGCTDFARVFGSDHFAFTFNDVFFFGLNTGPVLKMADGHVAPQDISWAEGMLSNLPKGQPVICVTHYPLQNGDVDNWFDLTDLLRRYNTQCLIGGHYHRNLLFNADGIADVLCRSNLRGKEEINGYTIITLDNDSIRFGEKVIGQPLRPWLALPFSEKHYDAPDASLRPDYSCNDDAAAKGVKETWRTSLGVGVYSAAALDKKNVYIGDDNGVFHALDLLTGEERWKTECGSRIASTPLVAKGAVVFGCTNGKVYCVSPYDGEKKWVFPTDRPVQGCPVHATIGKEEAVLIGGNGAFYAINIYTGKLIWKTDIKGYCVSRPLVYDDKVIFGAWDCNLYALRIADGSIAWVWNNGRTNDKLSPASVWPVAQDGKIFICAPDRVLSAIDATTGETIYRTADYKVRENIGLSADGNAIFAHCMWDTVVAMDARSATPRTLWTLNAGYGYDHDASMVISYPSATLGTETILFGTKNGRVYAILSKDNHSSAENLWCYKVGNCVVNTITPLPGEKGGILTTIGNAITGKKKSASDNPSTGSCIITSSDGNIVRLDF